MELRDKNGLTEEEFLAQYEPGDYERPSMTVDTLIFAAPGLKDYLTIPAFTEHSVKLLLIKRGGHPCLGKWALPGGFVNPDETITQAAHRELCEETGVKNLPLTQLYTFSQPGRDPRTWVMSCAHITLIDTDTVKPKAGDDADKAAWFDVRLKIMLKDKKSRQFKLILENGSTTLTSLLECPASGFDESTCKVLKNDGLAFDHPKMILCGLLKLLNI
jgi:8-oxo-dGTP diphosphatase